MGGLAGLPANLSVSPGSQKYTGRPVHIKVGNYGIHPIRVNASAVSLGYHCAMTHVSGKLSVSPASFILKPGQSTEVTAAISSHSQGDYGVLFQPFPTGAHSALTVSGAVGSQILTGKAATCTPPRHTIAIPPVHHSGGVPLLAVLIGVILFAALLTAILAAVVRRGRHRAA